MIKYNKKIDRAFDTETGKFVSFRHARLSSIFREEYEPVMLKKEIAELKKGLVEREELIERLESRGVPSKEWKLIIPKAEELSPLMMYTELKGKLSKYKYQKFVSSVEEIKGKNASNRKLKILREFYNKTLGIE